MLAAIDWIVYGIGWFPLLGGAGLLVSASFFAVDALAGDGISPGRRAIGQWIPIAVAALTATVCRRGDIALAIIFSTSVASLSLVLGSIVLAEPQANAPEAWRRLWPFILPAALLALLAGFAGRLTYIHAAVFTIEGMVLLNAWLERSELAMLELAEPAVHGAGRLLPLASISRLNLVLSILLTMVGATAAIFGTITLGQHMRAIVSNLEFSPGLVVIVILGPLLTLPMLFSGANLARRGYSWVATTTGAGVVLLNLCLLLPAVILLWYPVSAIHIGSRHFRTWHVDSFRLVSPLVYPLVTWRVDTVVLVLLGFVLLPISFGRWRLGRAEGMVLIGLYAIYILMETAAGMRL